MSQERIDAQAYPPTHTYQVDSLTPTGLLAERWGLLQPYFAYFNGRRFLDVGASKGFFSLYMKRKGFEVEAIESDVKTALLCKDLGINVKNTTFREWAPPERPFDAVFLGNVHHYCYQEAGWAWVKKLAAVTGETVGGGVVIIEGPDGTDCANVQTMTPALTAKQLEVFTWRRFFTEMSAFFELIHKEPTIAYTPDRYITVWRRHHSPVVQARSVDKKTLVAESKANGLAVYLQPDERVAKLYLDPPPFLERSLAFARTSALSVEVLEEIWDAGRFVGWTEPALPPDDRFARGWKQREKDILTEREIFRAACRRNAFLAKMGVVDLDLGPANWRFTPYSWQTVDKNSIWPIATLEDIDTHPETGRVVKTLEWASHPEAVPLTVRRTIAEALQTKDSVIIEKVFACVF